MDLGEQRPARVEGLVAQPLRARDDRVDDDLAARLVDAGPSPPRDHRQPVGRAARPLERPDVVVVQAGGRRDGSSRAGPRDGGARRRPGRAERISGGLGGGIHGSHGRQPKAPPKGSRGERASGKHTLPCRIGYAAGGLSPWRGGHGHLIWASTGIDSSRPTEDARARSIILGWSTPSATPLTDRRRPHPDQNRSDPGGPGQCHWAGPWSRPPRRPATRRLRPPSRARCLAVVRLPDGEDGPRPLSVKRVTGRPRPGGPLGVERDNPNEGFRLLEPRTDPRERAITARVVLRVLRARGVRRWGWSVGSPNGGLGRRCPPSRRRPRDRLIRTSHRPPPAKGPLHAPLVLCPTITVSAHCDLPCGGVDQTPPRPASRRSRSRRPSRRPWPATTTTSRPAP